ncbi:hypothetical protein N9414_18248 [Nodularia spumigena CCY9414]|nr:hypothetical protein N9414_18248 [Nodularia spumigena CCY9414]
MPGRILSEVIIPGACPKTGDFDIRFVVMIPPAVTAEFSKNWRRLNLNGLWEFLLMLATSSKVLQNK